MSELRIDPRLEATLEAHDAKYGPEFEKMLVEQGEIVDPILTWRGLIVDGHNRYRVAIKHGLPYTTREFFGWCNSIEDIQYEMRRMQVNRRNCTPAKRSEYVVANVAYMVGRGASVGDAVGVAAQSSGISERTAYRDLAKVKAIESISDEVKSVAPQITNLPAASLKTFSALPKAVQEGMVERTDGDLEKIGRELKRSREVPPKKPDHEVFSETDPRRSIKTQYDEERLSKRPFLDSISDAMQTLGTLNKQIAACKAISHRDYNDCRFAMKTIDEILERWLDEVKAAEGIV
jgi:hypothetical protein